MERPPADRHPWPRLCVRTGWCRRLLRAASQIRRVGARLRFRRRDQRFLTASRFKRRGSGVAMTDDITAAEVTAERELRW